MFVKFIVSNFYSIGGEQTFVFTKSGACPNSGFFEGKKTGTIKENISLVNGFWGSNASGKTNILRAITILISSMYFTPPNEQISIERQANLEISRNFKTKFKNKPTKLSGELLIGRDLYSYTIHYLNKNICFEELSIKSYFDKSAQYNLIYTRDQNGNINLGNNYKSFTDIINKLTLGSNQSVISASLQLGLEFALPIKKYRVMWNVGGDLFPSIIKYIQTTINLKHNQAWIDDNAMDTTLTILRTFDPTIESIDIKTEESVTIFFKHRGFDEMVDIQNESRGTQELFCYIYQTIDTMRKGGLVVYDEINRFLHPDIQNSIIGMFKNKRLNKNNAQLIFSSHDYEIINEIQKEQVNIVGKKDGETISNQIVDFEGYRSDVNQSKKVRLGLYGSMPDIGNFEYNLNEVI